MRNIIPLFQPIETRIWTMVTYSVMDVSAFHLPVQRRFGRWHSPALVFTRFVCEIFYFYRPIWTQCSALSRIIVDSAKVRRFLFSEKSSVISQFESRGLGLACQLAQGSSTTLWPLLSFKDHLGRSLAPYFQEHFRVACGLSSSLAGAQTWPATLCPTYEPMG